MIKQVESSRKISDNTFIIKYGQDFCIPCEMTENVMCNIKDDFSFPFYTCKNIDESIEKGYTNLPVIELHKNGKVTILDDAEIMMDEDELKGWLENNA